jgi:hypothetical protein
VWEAGVPVDFNDLASTDFVRHKAAREDGLTAGIGVPVFDGEKLVAVLLFLCHTSEICAAAFESWILEETRNELMPGTGFYANLDRFRRMTQYLRFPYGAGLPGDVWQTRMPRLMNRLADSTDFLRASGADAEGLDFGLAVPVIRNHDDIRSVVLLLCSDRSPISQVIQIWTPNEDRSAFELTSTVASGAPPMASLVTNFPVPPVKACTSAVSSGRSAVRCTWLRQLEEEQGQRFSQSDSQMYSCVAGKMNGLTRSRRVSQRIKGKCSRMNGVIQYNKCSLRFFVASRLCVRVCMSELFRPDEVR